MKLKCEQGSMVFILCQGFSCAEAHTRTVGVVGASLRLYAPVLPAEKPRQNAQDRGRRHGRRRGRPVAVRRIEPRRKHRERRRARLFSRIRYFRVKVRGLARGRRDTARARRRSGIPGKTTLG